jgi:hypothetical protein
VGVVRLGPQDRPFTERGDGVAAAAQMLEHRVVGPRDDDVGVVDDDVDDDIAVLHPLVEEGHVDHPVDEQSRELGAELARHDLDADLGCIATQLRDERREQAHRHGLERAHHQPPAGAALEVVELASEDVEPLEDPLGMPQHDAAGGRERRPAGAAGAVEDAHADGALEPGDLLADRGLAEAEHRCGVGEGPLLRDCAQGGEVPDLEVAQARVARCAHGHRMS